MNAVAQKFRDLLNGTPALIVPEPPFTHRIETVRRGTMEATLLHVYCTEWHDLGVVDGYAKTQGTGFVFRGGAIKNGVYVWTFMDVK